MAKNNIELVAHAQKALNEEWAYVYATYGQVITQAVIDNCQRKYPAIYTEAYKAMTAKYALGKRGADCIGLFKSYLWWRGDNLNPGYVSANDKSANGMFSYAKSIGNKWGELSDTQKIPEVKGLLVRKDGHVGIYIGDGWVIEAIGASLYTYDNVQYRGVVKTPLYGAAGKRWTHWYYAPFIEYVPTEPFKPTKELAQGNKGLDVKWVQQKLISLGYSCGSWGADGSFGSATLSAVKLFQKDYGLTITGTVNAATANMLENPIKPEPVIKNPYRHPETGLVFRYGSKGEGVKWIQYILKSLGLYTMAIDGSFGPGTKISVISFQRKYGLVPDGVVGPKTIAMLDKYNS